MKRHLHNLSHYHLTTLDMGKVYPVSCVEVMAGDVWRGSSSALVRSAPLVAPVMHPVQVKVHHWYVPFRLVWAGWEQFITGGSDGLGGSAGVYPTITAPGGGFADKSLPDYMHMPTGASHGSIVIGAMPIRAYNLIWNKRYRDRDLNAELAVPTTSGADATSPLVIQPACWEKDYFTSARPWAQKGPAVSIPLGTTAPVESDTTVPTGTIAGGGGTHAFRGISGSGNVSFATNPTQTNSMTWANTGMRANLATATASTVTALREAFALQRYQEARAQYGDRYVEYLRYYGIKPSDARLQEPEYLGGGKTSISFSEVLQTSDNGAVSGVGDMYGHGISALRTRPYARFFEEHGVVISILVIRPVAMYQHGLHRMHQRRIKEDYFTAELELIGQQEILRREVYAEAGAPGDTVFGYQDRYAEYCEHPSGVSAEMRSTLDFWHMARQFGAAPTLNAAFVNCNFTAANERRNWQGGTTGDPFWCFINHNIRARRFVRRNPSARII